MTRHYVISDLHLGMGHLDDGGWHPLEDFKNDDLFRMYLNSITDDGGEELIINGDWIDFHQLEPFAYPGRGLYSVDGHKLGWTESDSLNKLESCKAARAHKGFFDDLRHFLRVTGRKLTVVMGNHDPDLFWPEVQKEVRRILSPPKEHQLEFVQTFVRRGAAHIEHGNQYCSPENKFFNPSNVFHLCTDDGKDRLEMVWGTIFVMEFFNPIEQAFPNAANIKTQSRALWLGIKNGWVGGDMAAKFVKFIWGAGIPWSSISANVLDIQPRRPDELIAGIPDPEMSRDLFELYDSDSQFRARFDEEIALTPYEEWGTISPSNRQSITSKELIPVVEEDSSTLGIFRDAPEFRGASELLERPGVEYVIFGHTHTEIDGAGPNPTVRNYFNTGSWVNSLDLSKKENRVLLNKISAEDLKRDDLFELRLVSAVIDVGDSNETSVRLQRLSS